MKAKYTIIILAVFFGLPSCKDEIEPQYPREGGIQGNVKNEMLDNEVIYRSQTDKTNMVGGLIRYDYNEKEYILDISEEDALSIGITSEEYEQVQQRVEQMNSIDKEHL